MIKLQNCGRNVCMWWPKSWQCVTWWSFFLGNYLVDHSVLTQCDKILHGVKPGVWFPLYHPCLSAWEAAACPYHAPLQPGVVLTFVPVLAVWVTRGKHGPSTHWSEYCGNCWPRGEFSKYDSLQKGKDLELCAKIPFLYSWLMKESHAPFEVRSIFQTDWMHSWKSFQESRCFKL